jgi:hypothetical protein
MASIFKKYLLKVKLRKRKKSAEPFIVNTYIKNTTNRLNRTKYGYQSFHNILRPISRHNIACYVIRTSQTLRSTTLILQEADRIYI